MKSPLPSLGQGERQQPCHVMTPPSSLLWYQPTALFTLREKQETVRMWAPIGGCRFFFRVWDPSAWGSPLTHRRSGSVGTNQGFVNDSQAGSYPSPIPDPIRPQLTPKEVLIPSPPRLCSVRRSRNHPTKLRASAPGTGPGVHCKRDEGTFPPGPQPRP